MYINQEESYDCAPIAVFNALRYFDQQIPYYVFEDIKRNMRTGKRIVDYDRNDYCIGTFYRKEFLIIKELDMIGFFNTVKHEVAAKGSFCNKMRSRMLKLMVGPRVAIVRGTIDKTKVEIPYESSEVKEKREATDNKQGMGVVEVKIHCWFIDAIINKHANCVNLFSGNIATSVPVDALKINGYWVLEKK